MGVSSLGEDITEAKELYQEAVLALQLAPFHQNPIVFYEDLGIIGVLLQSD